MFGFFFLVGWVGGSFFVGHIANTKNNRNGVAWFFLSLFTSPLLGFFVLAIVGPNFQVRELFQNLKKQFGLGILDENEYSKRKTIALTKIANETNSSNHDHCINQLTGCVEEGLLTADDVRFVYNKFQETVNFASKVS